MVQKLVSNLVNVSLSENQTLKFSNLFEKLADQIK
jgi:hypothetical protein